MATFEMWKRLFARLRARPMLTIGAIEALNAHASDCAEGKYLPKMVSGEWMGSMNLTKPGHGTDLGA